MNKKLDSVKFNLTNRMSLALIEFNKLKKEVTRLQKLYNLDKDDKLLLKIEEIKNKMELCKKKFISEFRTNNKEEILEYLKLKDQK